jgi:putative oxygen-independent coproporphyrinogen III oxidase
LSAFGVYVHIPFCRERCDYCAFATYTDRDHLMERYADACVRDIQRVFGAADLPVPTSVFFGGGTPSRLHPELLCRILDAVPCAADAEVTVECNPEDADATHLGVYRRAGVTRVSFGLQSTQAHVLAGLGRRAVPHAAETVSAAVAAAGFDTWNLDLIFGAAGESDADWAATLEHVLTLEHPPPHLSAYALTVEPGTPLARDAARHPDDDAQARRYALADALLGAAGYGWEEISNWARPGHECRHNHLYWDQGDYVGIGSAAHSHRGGVRWWNVRTPERYIAAVEAGRSPEGGREELTAGQREFEALVLALRTRRGVPWELVADASSVPVDATPLDGALDVPLDGALDGALGVPLDGAFHPALDGALEGLVVREGDRAVLTVRGRLLANEVATRLGARLGTTILHR